MKSEFKLNEDLLKQFYTLTEYKQRDYVGYITEAKRPETRQKRLEKIIPLILKGFGIDDKYKK